MTSIGLRPALLFFSFTGVNTAASISARKLSNGTTRAIISSGSPLAVIAASRRSASKNPNCPILPTRESCCHHSDSHKFAKVAIFRGALAAIQRADSTDEMQDSHLFPGSSGTPLPERFLSRLVGFADLFTCPTWSNVLLLLAGAVLAPGRRTVSTALRILGRERDPNFCNFHRILNRAAWSSRAAARQLLILLVRALVPT